MKNTRYATLFNKYWHQLALLAIIILTIILRMGQPTLVEFKRDEATIARLGQAIAREGYLPAVGVDSSLGIDNLPLTLYLMALPLRLWSDPLAAVIFTMLLNVLAVGACYGVGRAFFDKNVALIATFLFAVSPWAVLYARKIWSRTLPIFTIAFMAALFITFVWKKRWALVAAFVSLAALLGVQLECLAFIPVLGVALILYRREVAWKPLLVGMGLCVLLLSPYIIHDAFNEWENTRGLLAYTGGEGVFSWDALRYAFMLTGSAGIEGQAGGFYEEFKRGVPNLWWLNQTMMLLLSLAIVYGCYQAIRGETQERRRLFTLMLLWFAAPILLQIRPSTATQMHYFVMHYPVRFLLIAVLLNDIAFRKAQKPDFCVIQADSPTLSASDSKTSVSVAEKLGFYRLGHITTSVTRLLITLFLITWGGWQIAVIRQLRVYMLEHPSTGGYGIPLYYSRAAAQSAIALSAAASPTGNAEIIVLTDSAHPFLTEAPTVFDALLFGHPHRFSDGRSVLPIPESPAVVYLIGPLQDAFAAGFQPMLQRLSTMKHTREGPSVVLPDGVSYRMFRRESNERSDIVAGMTPLGGGISFANKVIFAAYEQAEFVKRGATLEVWLAWWLQGPPPEADYHFTVQVWDAAGTPLAQADHAGFPTSYWQVGDLVLSRFAIPIPADMPPGDYRVRAGMYTYPDVTGVPVVDPAGTPVDDGVFLGAVAVSDE